MIFPLARTLALTLALSSFSFADSPVRISILSILQPKSISITLLSPEKTALKTPTSQKVISSGETIAIEQRNAKLISGQMIGSNMVYCPDHACRFRIEVGNQVKRVYGGNLTLTPGTNAINVVLQLSQSDFLASMAASEMGESRDPEALKAFAVVARSFLLAGRRHPSIDADLCDTTHCEVYQAFTPTAEGSLAVKETEGLVLTYKNAPFRPYYSRSCGGKTATYEEAWGKESPDYPFQSVTCPCRSEWSAKLSFQQLQLAFGFPIVRLQQLSNRVQVSGANRTITVSQEEFRSRVGQTSGWNLIQSDWFVMTAEPKRLVIHGKGIGHRVGLCQKGASIFALQGKNFLEILQYYFPNTEVRKFAKQ